MEEAVNNPFDNGYAITDSNSESPKAPLSPKESAVLQQTSNDNEMALQFTDSLSRTFVELKSRNEEVRLRASYDLQALVHTAARGRTLKG